MTTTLHVGRRVVVLESPPNDSGLYCREVADTFTMLPEKAALAEAMKEFNKRFPDTAREKRFWKGRPAPFDHMQNERMT